jgi:hypothetical protein
MSTFDVNVGPLSNQEEVCDLFRGILNESNARTEIRGLEQSSFSYDLPEDGLARISGYLHTNNSAALRDAAVRTWIFDDRIIGEIVWTPIMPGKNGNWRQHSLIRSIIAACEGCDGGTDTGTGTPGRRLEDWVGKSSDEIDRGGRPRHLLADRGQAGDGGSEAASGTAAPPPGGRGRPARPDSVASDTFEQAAVRSRLRSMRVETLRDICTMVIPNKKTNTRTPKESLVTELVSTPDKLALLAAALNIACAQGAASTDTPDLAQLTALRARLQPEGPAELASYHGSERATRAAILGTAADCGHGATGHGVIGSRASTERYDAPIKPRQYSLQVSKRSRRIAGCALCTG